MTNVQVFEKDRLRRISALRGSDQFSIRRVQSRMDLYSDRVVRSFRWDSIDRLVSNIKVLRQNDIAGALGIDVEALQRGQETLSEVFPEALASRAWLLAETLVTATDVFGDQMRAETWMFQPVAGLNGYRPIALLRTIDGAAIVGDFIGRLEHGVYS